MASIATGAVAPETVGVPCKALPGQPGGPATKALVHGAATVLRRPVVLTELGRRALETEEG